MWERVQSGWYRTFYDGIWFHVKKYGQEWAIYVTEDKYTIRQFEIKTFESSLSEAKEVVESWIQ